MCIFHKWNYIKESRTNTFMGEQYQEITNSSFRYCKKCGKYQQVNYYTGGEYWTTLNEAQIDILKSKVVNDVIHTQLMKKPPSVE